MTLGIDRLWRSLIRLEAWDKTHVYLVIPGWDTRQTVKIEHRAIPINILRLMKQGQRHFHAYVNIDVARSEDLRFDHWEDS